MSWFASFLAMGMSVLILCQEHAPILAIMYLSKYIYHHFTHSYLNCPLQNVYSLLETTEASWSFKQIKIPGNLIRANIKTLRPPSIKVYTCTCILKVAGVHSHNIRTSLYMCIKATYWYMYMYLVQNLTIIWFGVRYLFEEILRNNICQEHLSPSGYMTALSSCSLAKVM